MTAATVACAQMLFRTGQRDECAAFLNSFLREPARDNYFLRDIQLAQDRFAAGGDEASVLIRNMAIGGLDYLEYFKGRYCSRPFDEFQVRPDGEVFSCCPSFLPHSIGNAFAAKSVDDLTSSPMVAKIRDSVIKQDFRYCRWTQCPAIKAGLPSTPPRAKTDYKPVQFLLSYDPTCNLWCPSCRTEKIVAKGHQRERIMRFTNDVVLPMLRDAEGCWMNGYGAVFASKACRQILETANPVDFPRLKFDFITNGVLFTRAEWAKFPNIHDMVRTISVSVDAARKETYDQVRLGGDWDVLMDNLAFMSELRRDGVIGKFEITMVVQERNFREMADFARLARRLGCDKVVFQPLMNWNSFTTEAFEGHAVHYSSHPRHPEFRRELDRLRDVVPATAEPALVSDRTERQTVAELQF